jgi:hypothetical protein
LENGILEKIRKIIEAYERLEESFLWHIYNLTVKCMEFRKKGEEENAEKCFQIIKKNREVLKMIKETKKSLYKIEKKIFQ